jgi:L-iditol 2-dehydrogenase
VRAGVLERVEHLVVKEVPDPQLEEGSVILKVKVCSICGTDLRIYHYGHFRIELPQILGHEISGEIKAIGTGVKNYRAGDRVAVIPRIACGECFYCRKGQPIYCQNSQSFGYQLPGGYAEYLLVPSCGIKFGVLNKIPDAVSLEDAALAEPLSCCIRAQRASQVGQGDVVVIIGGGPLGIMHCRLAKANGAGQVLLIERDAKRLEGVNLSSVDEVINPILSNADEEVLSLTDGRGADVVIVACSSAQALEQAFSFAGRGGRVNIFAGLPPLNSNISLDSNTIHYHEVSVHGSHGSTPREHREALDMMVRKKIDVSDLMTHKFPLDSIEQAFLFAESLKGMHIAVIP